MHVTWVCYVICLGCRCCDDWRRNLKLSRHWMQKWLNSLKTRLADEIEQADSYRESIFSALIKIDKLDGAPPTNPNPHPPTRATPTESRGSCVRLPKLQLCHFSGDLTKWTSFWESFEAAVHHNEDLSEINSTISPLCWSDWHGKQYRASPLPLPTTIKRLPPSRRDSEATDCE